MVSKYDISKFINILDIADEFGIKLEKTYSGTFTHKCKCPSRDHKNGNESTAACNIDSENNKFWCFVCNAGLSVVDFYMLCAEKDFASAMADLSLRVSDGYTASVPVISRKNNISILLDISALFRVTMLDHNTDLKWISDVMKKTDDYVSSIDKYDLPKTTSLLNKLRDTIEKRYIK